MSLVDAIVLPDAPTERLPINAAHHVGRDVIVVQTKGSRLGMYLLGQAYFSKLLVERRLKPRSVCSVAVCTGTLRGSPFAKEHGVEVVVVPVVGASAIGRFASRGSSDSSRRRKGMTKAIGRVE